MMIRLYIVCVLYNKNILDIGSLDVFRTFCTKHDECRILIIDNSDDDYFNENRYKAKNIPYVIYIKSSHNIGLSVAYNNALTYIRNRNEIYGIMLADDDTLFSIQYLENAYFELNRGRYHIISGVVYAKEQPLSPIRKNRIFNNKKNFIVRKGIYRNIYCINSGLVLDSHICRDLKFNESIFLMMVDYWLMDYLIYKNRNVICIVDGSIAQNYSVYEKQKYEKQIERYKMFKKDFIVYCRDTQKSLFFQIVILFKRRIHLFIQKGYRKY